MTDEWLEDFLRRSMECDETNHLVRTWNMLRQMHDAGEIDEYILLQRLVRVLNKIRKEDE